MNEDQLQVRVTLEQRGKIVQRVREPLKKGKEAVVEATRVETVARTVER